MTDEALRIVGAGALAREVAWAAELMGLKPACFLVEARRGGSDRGAVPVRDDAASWAGARQVVVAIGDGAVRRRLTVERLSHCRFPAVVHPQAVVGARTRLGAGAMLIGPLCITVDAEVGKHVLINPGCNLAHDCCVGDYASLGPGCVLAGGAIVEEGANLGAGAIVLPGRKVGAWAVIGAGAVVTTDVAPGTTVAGVPARLHAMHGMAIETGSRDA